MIEVPIVLAGYGEVGRRYAELVRARREHWRDRYGVDLRIAAVRGRDTQTEVGRSGWIAQRERWRGLDEIGETLVRTGAAVLAQAVPSDSDERAVYEALHALRRGVHVVTATKSHLVTGWNALDQAAKAGGAAVRISAATGAAMPAGDLARSGLRGFDVESIEGCLTGTATFVLDRLSEGDRLIEATTKARRLGIAELDPRADLCGQDAANKMRLLTGMLWGWDVPSVVVDSEPITERARPSGSGVRLRQVASAERDQPGVVCVRLNSAAAGSTFGSLVGPEKAVVYDCGEAGRIVLSGGKSSPSSAAMAMVKDTFGAILEQTVGLW